LTLLREVQGGSAAGWQRLCALYKPLVMWWCSRKGLSSHDTEDVAQDVFVTVQSRIGEFRPGPQPGSFRAWLRTITDHKVGDFIRRSRKQPEAAGGSTAQKVLEQVPDDTGGDVAEPDSPDERRILLRRALELVKAEVEPRTWEAAWRTTVLDQRPADVAADLGMTPNAVYIARSRVLSRLRELLADLEE
jgi:RNA polymerase sigma-70 factor (ECF subfamily)